MPAQNEWNELLKNSLAPKDAAAVLELKENKVHFYNEAQLLNLHRAGSVFKLITAAALFEAGLQDMEADCHGEQTAGLSAGQRCWLRAGHGHMDLRQAITKSCNVYFYKVSPLLPPGALQRQMALWNLDKLTGWHGEEARPLLPPALTAREVADCAIGDCDNLFVSGLTLLKLAAILSGNWAPAKDLNVPIELRHAMYRVVEQGTAKAAKDSAYQIAGKTGTARKMGSWRYEGWFIAFVPFENPRYALVVYTPDGQGKDAAAAANKLIKAIMERGISG